MYEEDENMLTLIRGNDPSLDKLSELFPETDQKCIDDLLRILIHQGEEEKCFIKGESTIRYYSCSLDEKIQLEIAKWIGALQRANKFNFESLGHISPALKSVCQSGEQGEVRSLVARTLRMVQLYEALILGNDCSPDNPYGPAAVEALAKQPSVRATVESVRNARHSLDSAWNVSLALAVLVALAESQCEYLQPFTWEAYSAGRARDELLRVWPAGDSIEAVINAIAVFIRCQSAVGQAIRGTASPAFIERFACGADSSPRRWIAFDADQRVDALQLMAVVEEARNHRAPENKDLGSEAKGVLNSGVSREWVHADFMERAALYTNFVRDGSACDGPLLYQYMRGKYVAENEAEIETLNKKIEALKNTLSATTGTNKPIANCQVVSFGRDQVERPLRGLMREVLLRWPENGSDEEQQRYFERYFRRPDAIGIPDNYSAARKEGEQLDSDRTLRVLMKDALAAEQILFPGTNPGALINNFESSEWSDVPSAADLFQHLLDRAKAVLEPTLEPRYGFWDYPNDGRAAYVPFPLVRRISNIVFRLRGHLCFSIPIAVDGGLPDWIRIPADVKAAASELQLILANFVLASILNRAMAKGIDHAEVDLKGLVLHKCGIDAKSDDIRADSDIMKPDEWRKTIRNLYRTGGYWQLLGPYMRNYNTHRDIVRFLGVPSDDSDDSDDSSAALPRSGNVVVGSSLIRSIADHLRTKQGTKMLLVGVDIGGTLTKIQLFLFRSSHANGPSRIEPASDVFRMQTEDPEARMEEGKEQTLGTPLAKGTERFAERLVREVLNEWRENDELQKKLCDSQLQIVIGLTWPGPIRNGHIAGISRPLNLLYWPVIPDPPGKVNYTIDDLFGVDIPKAVSDAWRKVFAKIPMLQSGKGSPFVSVLNDGDGEAVGTIMEGAGNEDKRTTDVEQDAVLAVIKLGTGLAGGSLKWMKQGFVLQTGPFEWGKLLLDVGAPPKKEFPQGVAAEYLSTRSLSRLATRLGEEKGSFQEEAPDSGEIGRIGGLLDKINNAKNNGYCMDDVALVINDYQDLIWECGARQAGLSRPWGVPVSVDVVRLLLEKKLKKGAKLFRAVQLALRIYPEKDLLDQVRTEIDALGRTRLDRLLKWPLDRQNCPELPEVSGMPNIAKALYDIPCFQGAGEVALDCIRALGAYLGDFCVLLHDQLEVNQVILSGGVLSDRTGEIAIDEARKRVRLYGLSLGTPMDSGALPLTVISGENDDPDVGGQPARRKNSAADRGTLGAASFAAAAFIEDLKATGRQLLTACLLPLGAARRVEIRKGSDSEVSVLVDGKRLERDNKPIDFSAFALTEQDLIDFMKEQAVEWDYYQVGETTFVRWIKR
ncbi:MAG TPA: hypothetical protein DDY14_11270 [Chromatiaceae bacterium]|nr:MAG: hypothetical protein N838_07295 [Thiohalocapsa sp. PB-PSB1]HBG95871.1 hypothetical protein [Chromatiaceae bacterium]HCS89528.1 hypothetical protein [Chromatiaceae bacterium]